ncbi:MAG TPA: MFS transporter [Vitreimonas sp.]|uniref:nitrate/nitrite transporter n=1 Tax=Vitreimonas sp. TaxID=3069702 RepID=UPI002D3B46FA|nr:MFS transporter [Vitreimonas sp.]HYD89303.1 MFS transporter [Vitreimonas sp.]
MSPSDQPAKKSGADAALWLSTIAFTACFAVWTIFSIIGVKIKQDLGLTETQFGLLIGTPILTGSLIRLVLGVWTEQFGGRLVNLLVMLAAAAATFLLSYAQTYEQFLIAALGVGIAGGSFAVGVAYVSKFYPAGKQGTALGIFGAGNVGSAVTKFLAPFVLLAFGWEAVAQYWAIGLVAIAVLFFLFTKDDPDLLERRKNGVRPRSMREQFAPLKNVQVWRFSLYYFFVFGAFVALALWLPSYLVGVYGLDLKTAGMMAAFFSVPASLFRIYGGHLSDKVGARQVMYWTFLVGIATTFLLSYPPTSYVIEGIEGPIAFRLETGLIAFTVLVFVLGFFMSLGKAAVFKHIPVYYPKDVGAVGGLVGMIGGLGGFVLPIAFGMLNDLTGIWTSCFMLLFLIVAASLVWMHFAIRQMERDAAGKTLDALPQFPEMQPIHNPAKHKPAMAGLITEWRPEDPVFWNEAGKAVASRNLWLSVPALFLSFAVWMIWSVVVAKLPQVGFAYTTDQLFWLAALPGLSGATFRIFYSFMVPVFGGRLWTTLTTWSLMIPALGIGFAVQNPETPYWIMLALALLCGLGGGNFASSMSNIGFFFPRSEKGNALALNAGLGNLGVSAMQFLVPLVITAGVFGALGGEGQVTAAGETLFMQNAGFIWVPFIVASAFMAWFGMNDLSTAKASFAEQSVIFSRTHNWIMCWLYTGTFGSFIGFSAAFPLLTSTVFPDVNVLQVAFLGPLVGALSRSLTGWIADRFGGGRVTIAVFLLMMLGTIGVIYFLANKTAPGAFTGFFACFMLLFFASGVGNASTFQMIPAIMRKEIARLAPDLPAPDQLKQAEKESAAITGFTSAIAAFGAFFIPKSFGFSIEASGSAAGALIGFLLFYVSCLAITWFVYVRPGGLLFDVENKRAAPADAANVAAQ